jgi:tetratricopeptide (TPR) repeat protein
MSWFRRRPAYDRASILARAARAARGRSRRSRRKAIELFTSVLRREPANQELRRKLAPLLAADGQSAAAWSSYERAIEDLARRGFVEQAIGVCREAAGALRREPAVWRALAALEVERGRKVDAVRALLEGRAQLRSRHERNRALELLREARRIDPVHLEAGLELARLLARTGRRAEACAILDELIAVHPHQTRRLRAAQLRIAPGLRSACRWLRSLGTGSAGERSARLPRWGRAHSGRPARCR